MLRVENLEAFYSGNRVLKGVSLEVREGEIVCLIGANGAGKTTLLNCLSNVHPHRSGKIFFMGKDVSAADSQALVRMGIVQVPENRELFKPLTVEENLEMGAYLRTARMSRKELAAEMDRVYALFPPPASRRRQRAGTLSGGEQQMVAIGRGLMADPRLLLLDEPSLGLAPLVVREIFRIVQELRNEGRTILLVEQNAVAALRISQRAYVMENGRITLEGPATELAEDLGVRRAFLGQDVARAGQPPERSSIKTGG
jgi:branched-chain amino acid transport system ATP-binding protein